MGRGEPLRREALPATGPRVAIFIDGKNFYRALQDFDPDFEIDYLRFAEWLTLAAGGEGARFAGALYCTGYAEHDPVRDTPEIGRAFGGFLDRLTATRGYTVRREPRVRRTRPCGRCGEMNEFSTEKRVDARLVAELVRGAATDAYDVAVLCTGDSDLLPAVDIAVAAGKRVLIGAWPRQSIAADLRAAAPVLGLADGAASYIVRRTRIPDTSMAAAFGAAGVLTPRDYARQQRGRDAV